jgi:alpha-tubulin suppressor-like RCC1 family protein
MRIAEFVDTNVRIMQISAGVDMSMAVDVQGNVYAWGKTDGGRIGLGISKLQVTLPRRVSVTNPETGAAVKCVDVECGYVHSVIVGLDGTLHMCGKYTCTVVQNQTQIQIQIDVFVHDGQKRTTVTHILTLSLSHPLLYAMLCARMQCNVMYEHRGCRY